MESVDLKNCYLWLGDDFSASYFSGATAASLQRLFASTIVLFGSGTVADLLATGIVEFNGCSIYAGSIPSTLFGILYAEFLRRSPGCDLSRSTGTWWGIRHHIRTSSIYPRKLGTNYGRGRRRVVRRMRPMA